MSRSERVWFWPVLIAAVAILYTFRYAQILDVAKCQPCLSDQQSIQVTNFFYDFWVLLIVAAVFAAALYLAITVSQAFLFGRNWLRLIVATLVGWLGFAAILRSDFRRGCACLYKALGPSSDVEPWTAVLGFGPLLVRVAVDSLVLIGLAVLVSWGFRYAYLRARAHA